MRAFVIAALLSFTAPTWATLVVYTDRPKDRFAKAAAAYEAATGESVTFSEMGFTDIEKNLVAEGQNTPANVVITKDVVYLNSLKQKNLFRAMEASPVLDTVNDFMRDADNQWVGVSFRVRSVIYAPSRVNAADITTYEDLADAKWAGRLCLRSGKAAYNEALVASLIAKNGEAETANVLTGWLDNLAAPIFKDDLAIIDAITNGVCDLGIVNHYYLAMALDKNPNLEVKMAFVDQNGLGVSTNGMGAGLTSANKNVNAQKFIELLLTPENQLSISRAHFDFPVVKGLAPDTFIKDWGTFKMNPTSWSEIGSFTPAARDLISKAGYQ